VYVDIVIREFQLLPGRIYMTAAIIKLRMRLAFLGRQDVAPEEDLTVAKNHPYSNSSLFP
jgi:hypothetical protein